MVSTRSTTETVALSNGNGNSSSSTRPTSSTAWYHSPSRITALWMAISLPLVIWDTIYVLGRPLTMEGGSLHWPLWVPYQLYGEVDHVYGWKAFNAGNGFTSAQGFLNLVETSMYFWYLAKIYNGGAWKASGRQGAQATLIGFSAAVMTLSKTVLYCKSFPHSSTIDSSSSSVYPIESYLTTC